MCGETQNGERNYLWKVKNERKQQPLHIKVNIEILNNLLLLLLYYIIIDT